LTGTGTQSAAAEAGFDQLIWKPADLDHVVSAVRAGIARAGSVPPE
jgi:DNA-binding response OmpR family regulator